MPQELRAHIAEIFEWLELGLILPAEVLARVGLALVESGTPADIADLPPRLRDQLVEWARETCNYYSKRDKE